jgi:hypothetical protein
MSMRALRLNFIAQEAPRWPGFALLAMAAVVAGLVCYHYVSATRSVTDAEFVVSRLERRLARGRDSAAPISPAVFSTDNTAIQRAGELTRRLNAPWETLFKAMETVRHDRVALLAVEPDTIGGTVRIMAEAKDVASMLEYVDEQRDIGLLKDVVLSHHQVDQQHPYKPVRFAFTGVWMDKR